MGGPGVGAAGSGGQSRQHSLSRTRFLPLQMPAPQAARRHPDHSDAHLDPSQVGTGYRLPPSCRVCVGSPPPAPCSLSKDSPPHQSHCALLHLACVLRVSAYTSPLPGSLHRLPRSAITNDHKQGGFKQETLPSPFWRPKVRRPGVGQAGSCWGSGGTPVSPRLLAGPAALAPPGR